MADVGYFDPAMEKLSSTCTYNSSWYTQSSILGGMQMKLYKAQH